MKNLAIFTLAICAMFFTLTEAKDLSIKIPAAKIDEFIAQNPNLPDFDKSCLMNGEFKVGIQAITLKFMFGEPRKVTRIKQPWAMQEEWFYKLDGNLYFTIENDGVVGIEERKR